MFVHINICIRNFMDGVILKKIYIIFIYKYSHYNPCQCCFEEDKNYFFIHIYFICGKIPK